MSSPVLIRPLLTEKSENLRKQKEPVYTFVVAKSANKIEITKAVETMFNVSVKNVNTAILPGKNKSRSSKSGVMRGVRSGYKKAFVLLVEGEKIDLFDDAAAAE